MPSLVFVESVSFYKICFPSVFAGLHIFYTQRNPSVSYVKLKRVFLEQVWDWRYVMTNVYLYVTIHVSRLAFFKSYCIILGIYEMNTKPYRALECSKMDSYVATVSYYIYLHM